MASSVHNTNSILRRVQVQERTGLSRSLLYKLMKEGKFPGSVKLSARAVGWRSSHIDQWLADRPAKPLDNGVKSPVLGRPKQKMPTTPDEDIWFGI